MNGGTLNFLALYISSILESLNFFGARLLKKRVIRIGFCGFLGPIRATIRGYYKDLI